MHKRVQQTPPRPARREYSKQLNEQRIKLLTAREEAIQQVLVEAKLRLRDVAKNPASYKKLLTDFLVQVRAAAPSGQVLAPPGWSCQDGVLWGAGVGEEDGAHAPGVKL